MTSCLLQSSPVDPIGWVRNLPSNPYRIRTGFSWIIRMADGTDSTKSVSFPVDLVIPQSVVGRSPWPFPWPRLRPRRNPFPFPCPDAVNCRADLSIVMTLNSKLHRIATLTHSGWVAGRGRPAYSPESRRLFIVFGPSYGRDSTPTPVTARCRSPRGDRTAGCRAATRTVGQRRAG